MAQPFQGAQSPFGEGSHGKDKHQVSCEEQPVHNPISAIEKGLGEHGKSSSPGSDIVNPMQKSAFLIYIPLLFFNNWLRLRWQR